MDPVSASVTVVGFAASLTTLAALVIDSSRTPYNVRRKFRNAPEDVNRLYRQLREFQCLLFEVQERMRDHEAEYAASGIKTLFATTIDCMRKDLGEFECAIQNLKALLSGSTSYGKRIVSHIWHILQEERVREFQRLNIFSYRNPHTSAGGVDQVRSGRCRAT
ncbi:hypothetical protein MMC30_009369 [Trapelia coarctata]|nr:hypothetical protein [Trapelia coarctata]